LSRIKFALGTTLSIALAALAMVLTPEQVSAAMTLVTVRVPEPATTLLVATGVAGVALEARRRNKKK